MTAGMIVRSFRGFEGKITIPGLGAVIATFNSWTIKRREEIASPGAEWALHAVLSYQNDSLLTNEAIEKEFVCVLNKDKTIKLCGYDSLRVEGTSLIVEGVVQCQ